jgi:hypothetical protein
MVQAGDLLERPAAHLPLLSLHRGDQRQNKPDFPAIWLMIRSRAAPGVANGEAGWTGPPGLTINRRSLAAAPGSAQVAQLVEHATENRSVGGSIPPLGTKHFS